MGTCDEKNSADEAHTLKAQGNELFKVGDYVGALEKYTDALKCTDQDNDKAIVLNNRAAANIKLRRYDDAIKDASEVLELVPTDLKALYRRSQAYEALGKIDEAFKDARNVLHLDPKNAAIQQSLQRLSQTLQELASYNIQGNKSPASRNLVQKRG